MRAATSLGSAVLLLALAAPSFAGWSSPGDTLFGYYGGAGSAASLFRDASGGILVVSALQQQGVRNTHFHHVAADGTPLPDFSAPGDLVRGWALDSLAGAWESSVYLGDISVYHQFPSGSSDPVFNPRVVYDDASGFGPATSEAPIAPDDSGGVYVVNTLGYTSTQAWRMRSDGTLADGWPEEGVTVRAVAGESMYPGPVAIPDGSHGLLIGLTSVASNGAFSMRAYRYRPNGTRRWGTLATTDHPSTSSIEMPVLALLLAGDHVFYCWAKDSASTREVRLQSLNLSNGLVTSGWPATGMVVAQGPLSTLRFRLAADGTGGIFLFWIQEGVARALRMTAAGTPADGWPGEGRALLPAGAPSGANSTVAIGSDGKMVVFWGDGFLPGYSRIRARWLLADGTPDPGLPDTGQVVVPAVRANPCGAMSDGNGGAYLFWADQIFFQTGQNNPYILSPVPYPGAPVGVGPSVIASPSALRAWPNPAHDILHVAFRLPDPSPARIELLDIGGRLARALIVPAGAESQARFEHLDHMPPGMYFVRLQQRGVTRVTRVALIR